MFCKRLKVGKHWSSLVSLDAVSVGHVVLSQSSGSCPNLLVAKSCQWNQDFKIFFWVHLHQNKCVTAGSTNQKDLGLIFYQQSEDSNPGRVGEKRERSLCPMSSPQWNQVKTLTKQLSLVVNLTIDAFLGVNQLKWNATQERIFLTTDSS